MKIAFLIVTLFGFSASAFGASSFVGENIARKNNLTFGLGYTPTKKTFTPARKTGTAISFSAEGDYNFLEDYFAGFDLPIYLVDTIASTTKSRFSIGSTSVNVGLARRMINDPDQVSWGYALKLDLFLPTSLQKEAVTLQKLNVPLDLIRYGRGWASAQPFVTIFTDNSVILVKGGIGFAYSYIVKKSAAATSATRKDQNRMNIPIQAGLSYKLGSSLAINAEYNTMILDKPTRQLVAIGTKDTRFRQVLTPSVSGSIKHLDGQVYVNVPIDAASRRTHIVSPGIKVGFSF